MMNRRNNNLSLKVDHRPDQSGDFPIFDPDLSMEFVDDLISSFQNQFEPDANFIEEIDPKNLSPSEMEDEQPVAGSTNSPNGVSEGVLNLICAVCGVPAHGYNFDQVTCESCKAFFRRNALRNTPNLKCRFSGNCVINAQTRRLCTYCRLKKCFDVKMRKEWIRTDEERQVRELIKFNKQQRKLNKVPTTAIAIPNVPIVVRKKKRLGLHSTKSIQPKIVETKTEIIERFPSNRILSSDDQMLLSNITNAYRIGADMADCSHIGQYGSSSILLDFVNNETQNHQSLIYYFKNVPQFKQCALQDQVLLIKCNMIDLIHLHHIVVQNFQEHPQIGMHMSKWISLDFHREMSLTRKRFDCFMNYPLVIKLALIVLVFSTNLSNPRPSDDGIYYTDSKKLFEQQNFFVSLLWKYLNYLFDEDEATRSVQLIIMQILRYQTLMDRMEDSVMSSMVQDKLHSLMKSIFRLT